MSYEKLPQKLTNSEQRTLLTEMHEGDIYARDLLIQHNLRLVVYLANKYTINYGHIYEELVSAGTVGLIKGVDSFDISKPVQVATYLSRCIENDILMYIRKTKRITDYERSLSAPCTHDDEGHEMELGDYLQDTSPSIEEMVEDKWLIDIDLKKCLAKLSPKIRAYMELRYGLTGKECMTQLEASQALGISQSYGSRIEKRVLLKMRAQLTQTPLRRDYSKLGC
jgi:RNA polymerase sporulation-specific sigma factor